MTENEVDGATATLIDVHQTIVVVLRTLGQPNVSQDTAFDAHMKLLNAAVTCQEVLGARAWPPPTTMQPDEATIEAWLTYDDCQATDGCFVEESEVCQHGYPSWPRYLRLI